MSLLTQLIYKIVGNVSALHNKKSVDKDAKKPTEEDSVSRSNEKSLVRNKCTVFTSPEDYGGLLNLVLMMGVVLVLKLLLGMTVIIPNYSLPVVNPLPRISLLPLSLILYPVFAMLLTFRIEVLMSKQQLRWEYALVCYVTTLAVCLAIPVFILRRQNSLDLLLQNLLVCFFYIILTMKLVSFIQVNKISREKTMTKAAADYPINLSIANLFMFCWAAPTLVYEAQGYCLPPIRMGVVVKRCLELGLLQVAVRQGMLIMHSVVDGLLRAAESEDLLLVIERFLTLSLAFNFVWILSFYILFVSFMGLIAEVSQARERLFYHAWWNASTLEEFWRWWNLPVHRWCVKHIYVPLVKSNYTKFSAMLAVFLASATLHEYLISCPIQIAGHFAFFGFLGQLPLIKISEVVRARFGGRAGNLLVWSVLVFGNTSGVITYYKKVVDSS